MRTTFNAVNRHTQFVIERKYAELATLQKKIATGKELTRPSDDPVAVSNVLALRSNNKGLEQFEKNINDGLSWMEITDTTMVSMNTILQRGRELAIQGDSDTLSETERAYIAEEVEQLTRQMISLANSRYKGDYIFSGSHTDKPAIPIKSSTANKSTDYINFKMAYFDGTVNPKQIKFPDGSGAFKEDAENIIPGSMTIKYGDVSDPSSQIELVEGQDYSVNYQTGQLTLLPTASTDATTALSQDYDPAGVNYSNGFHNPPVQHNIVLEFDMASVSEDIYGNPINTNSDILREIESGVKVSVNTTWADFDVNNGTNAVTSMIQLGEALLGDNQVGIRNAMDRIDESFNKILSAQSENGAKVNLFSTTRDRNENQQIETTRIQAELEDADYSEVISKYSVSQTVFNAALQSTAKIMQSSLANYI